MAKTVERACDYCGELFMPRDGRNKYCSEECRYQVKKMQIKLNNKRAYDLLKKEQIKKRCSICKKTFITSRSDVVTCSPYCQKIRTAENRKERERLKKEEEARLAALPKPKSIAEINAEARAMGMNYGAYVAYMERKEKEKKNAI